MAQLVKLEPGDVLVLSNLSEAARESLDEMGPALKRMLGVEHILVFEGDVDLSKVAQERERAALVKCARALAFSYGGCPRPEEAGPEEVALWEAMHSAYAALGVTDTRSLPGLGGRHAVAGS